MTMAELETAVRESAPGSSSSSSTTSATARSGCGRSGAATGSRRRDASSVRSTSRRSRGRAARAASRVERDADFEPALRAALVADRADGHPARPRPGLGVDRPAARLMRPTFHLVPVEVWAAADPAAPLRGGVARRRGVHPLHRRRRRARRDVRPPLRGRPAAVPGADPRPRRARRPVAVRRAGLAVSAHLRPDRPRGDPRGRSRRPRRRRPVRRARRPA